MIGARLWLHDQRCGLIARYRTWLLFRAWPWTAGAVKRETP